MQRRKDISGESVCEAVSPTVTGAAGGRMSCLKRSCVSDSKKNKKANTNGDHRNIFFQECEAKMENDAFTVLCLLQR